MKMNKVMKALALLIMLATLMPVGALAQQGAEPAPQQQGEKEKSPGIMSKIFGRGKQDKKDAEKKDAQKKDAQSKPQQNAQDTTPSASSSSGSAQSDSKDKSQAAEAGVPADIQAGRREQISEEEAAVVPYYNNYMKNYRLGPEDVISVDVFNQPRYSKANITVPPDGRISFPLISEGVVVVGKTTQQVQEEIQKKLDEYIIEPQVTVYLDKAMSARYSVLGDVGKPGIMIMTRRLSVIEAIAEAGGISNTGDKKRVVILRHKADGSVYAKPVNVAAIEKGQIKEMEYLVPGDQIIVPGNRLKTIQTMMGLVPILAFGRIFGLPY